MAEQKKNKAPADDQKASSIMPDATLTPVGEPKKKIRKAPKVKKPKKKGVPLVLDILIVVVLLVMIAGAVFGVYSIGKYFSTRYTATEITYTLLLEDVDASIALDEQGNCIIAPGSTVYLAEEATHVMGKVRSVSADLAEDGTANLHVSVSTTAGYNHTLGYFAEQTKIAVGKSYTCRFDGLMAKALIVELQVEEKES